jgi:hypothetical protein
VSEDQSNISRRKFAWIDKWAEMSGEGLGLKSPLSYQLIVPQTVASRFGEYFKTLILM